MSRRPLLLVSSLLLLLVLLGAFFNVTEVDVLLREVLRAVVPQRVQDAVRPLRAPMVIGFSPEWEATEVPLRSPVTITFLTPMSGEATEDDVTITPAVSGDFTWRGATLVFTPAEDWPIDTVVTVSVGRDARSWLLRRMERGFAFSFTTLGPPAVVETGPPQGVRYTYLPDRLSITFSRPMDQRSVENRLSVTPEMDGQQLAWQDEELTIIGSLQRSVEYRVVIGRGARDAAYGMETAEDFEWTFVPVEHPPYLSFPGTGNEVLITPEEASKLQLSLSNVSRVDAELYALAIPVYITMTQFSGEDWRQFSPEQTSLSSWSVDPQVTPEQEERRDLDLDPLEEGLYYLAVSSPEGAGDSRVLISSRIALTMKRAADDVLVWATSIDRGQPVPELPLAIHGAHGGSLVSGVTDENGLFQAHLDQQAEVVYAVAQDEEGLAICSDGWDEGIEPWRFEQVLWDWDASSDKYQAFLYTDRPAYAPGQEVNFRGVFAMHERARYVQPDAGTVVSVSASNYQGDVIYQKDLVIAPYGTIHDSFWLSEQVNEGQYLLTAAVDGEKHQTTFQIEQEDAEPFGVEWVLGGEDYLAGEVISGTLVAEYHFGVPVRGATVDYIVYASEYLGGTLYGSSPTTGCEGTSCWRYVGELAVGHGVTSENGEFAVALRADAGLQAERQRLTLEATVTDDAGQRAVATAAVAVHGGQFRIDLLPERLALLADERAWVAIRTTGITGEPLGGVELFYDIQVSEYEMVPDAATGDGFSSWQEIGLEVERSRITTDSEGLAAISFTPGQGGVYRVEVWGRDEGGRRILASSELWVGDPRRWVAWRFAVHDRVELIPDKKVYGPDDTARVLVQSPYEKAIGLVTVERAEILSHYLVTLDSNSAMLEIPLEREYAPNVYVSLTLVPRDGIGGPYGGFKVGYAELNVRSTESQLQIELTPDQKTYQPGQMASLTVRTRDHLDRPVSAEVSLGVLDATILTPDDSESLEMVDAFYGRRRLGVRTAQCLTRHAARQGLTEDYGGAGRMGEQEPQRALSALAYWNPAIVTDDRGVARASFQIPERLTTWKAYARGVTEDYQMGAAGAEISVREPLLLWASAPSFLYEGDSAVIKAFVENPTNDPVSVQLAMQTTGVLTASQEARNVVVEAGRRVTSDWPVQAGGPGLATFAVLASAGEEYSDLVQRSVSVLPFGEHRRAVEAYVVEGQALQKLSVPSDAGTATLTIDVAPSLTSALFASVEYLMEHQAISVEETVSRFLPGLVLDQVVAKRRGSGEDPLSELPGLVEDSLQRLNGLQNRDGGWGWVEGAESNSYHTGYVVLGLQVARDAGYPVNERVLHDALEFLSKVSLETRDLDEKAYISYVLSECQEGDLSLARSLSERRRRMGLYAQACLSLALSNMGDQSSARQIATDLAAAAVETAHTAHWTEEDHDLAAISSDGRTTAVVLQAIASTDPDHSLLTQAVNWLMWERDGGFWRSTYETSQIVSALAAYLAATGEVGDTTGYQVYLDDELVAKRAAPPDGQAPHPQQITAELSPGEHVIEVVGISRTPLYLSTVLDYGGPRLAVGAARSLEGPRVERSYEAATTGEPLDECSVGDLVKVRLRVEVPEEVWYAVVEDPLSPGMELVETSSLVGSGGDAPAAGFRAHVASLGEGIGFFATLLPAGSHEFSYLVRATAPGQFKVMPAEMTLVYHPGVWGRSSSASLTIVGQP